MKIGILQTGDAVPELAEKYGEYPDMFAVMLHGHDFEFEAFPVVSNVFPASADACDGWLITGSKHGAYEDLDWIPPLEDLIREIYTKKLPLIGVCFGHQIIAQALGGKVEKSDQGWRIGNQTYDMEGSDKPLNINAWHQDQVVKLPEDARVVGTNPYCEFAALSYGDQAYTLQPHPEFPPDFIKGLMETRGDGVVPSDLLAEAHEKLSQAVDTKTIAAQFAAFFKGATTTT